jgi:hypothetical protein
MSAESLRVRQRRRRAIVIVVAVLVGLVVFAGLWVGVRGMMARTQLVAASTLAQRIEASALSGDTAATAGDVKSLQSKSARAVELTSDPVWRATEVVPGLGPNLVAVRQTAALVHQISVSGIPPLIDLASAVKLHDLVPHNGTFDLAVFTRAAPTLMKARLALDRSKAAAEAIHPSQTLPVIRRSVSHLVNLVESTASTIDGVDTAATLLPTMLGADGPRNYLLLSLNSSELRTPGGIPGALAVVHADHGQLTLDQRTSATALGRANSPVLPLSAAEKTLYDERLGTYMQNVVSTPKFARSGQLAQAMWKLKTGQDIDGVVAIDPVALGYILSATGPIDVGSGVTLNSSTAAKFLLSTVYQQIPDTTAQDDFFAGATRSIFGVLTGGSVNGSKLLDALSRSASQDRIHVWSVHPDEEKQLIGSTLAGGLPQSTAKSTAFGVYFNDATGAKMDFYLRSSIDVAAATCRSDGRPNFSVGVNLNLAAPRDAATVLPSYVTGRYAFGVEPGRVRTNVYVYAPPGAQPFSVTVDGKEVAFVSAKLDSHPVVGVVVEQGPQQKVHIGFKFIGDTGDPTRILLQHTPMYAPVATDTRGRVDCSNP